jgi:hypothetical protein
LVEFNKIRGMLEEVERVLLRMASTSPIEPLVSDYVRTVSRDVVETVREYKKFFVQPTPFFIVQTINHLYEIASSLYSFVYNLYWICYDARRKGIADPEPCETYTLDLPIGLILMGFQDLAKRLGNERDAMYAESSSRSFLDRLRSFSSACMQLYGVNCLKYASPDKVVPVPLRSHVLDLISAVRRADVRFTELYRGVRKWKVGHVLFYDQHGTTQELLDLAEYVANVLHKQLETRTASIFLRDRIAVLSLRNMVEILIRDIDEVADIVVKPRWVIDIYADLDAKHKTRILKRILEKMGFKTEPTAFGLKITIPPGDIMEAVKIVSMLPSMIASRFVEFEEYDYYKSMSVIRMLELELKEQKPLKRRKVSL